MTPLTLFEYIFAVVCGIGLGVIAVALVFSMCMDWESYDARQQKRREESES